MTTKLTATAYALAMDLFSQKADKAAIPTTKNMLDRKLAELVEKGVAQREGAKPGRGGLGNVKLMIAASELESIPDRKPRSSKATKVAAPSTGRSGDLRSALRDWEAYFMETRPEFQREYNRRNQSVSIDDIAKRARELQKGPKPMTNVEALSKATEELSKPYHSWLREKYGDAMVDLLTPPEVGPDTPDRVK